MIGYPERGCAELGTSKTSEPCSSIFVATESPGIIESRASVSAARIGTAVRACRLRQGEFSDEVYVSPMPICPAACDRYAVRRRPTGRHFDPVPEFE